MTYFYIKMDVKTTSMNGELEEENFMRQLEEFANEGNEHMVCKLGKANYGLKQASMRWYFKFHQSVSSYGFEENIADQCIYLKKCGSRFIFLVLYVDDILLATNDHNLLKDTKELLSNNFEMKDLGEAAFVLGIEIQRDRARGLLGLSQKTYIERVLKCFDMSMCSGQKVPLAKGDLKKEHCPKNKEEEDEMRNKPYASLVGSIMYAQVCTRPDLALCISKMGRFQSDPGMQHWIVGKKVLRYLQRTKAYMLIYRRTFRVQPCFFPKYIACYEATSHAVWLRNFIKDIKVVDSIYRPIQCFIQAAWHHYKTKFAEKQRNGEEEGFDYSEGDDDDDDYRGSSITSKLPATFIASCFAAKAIRGHRRHSAGSTGSMGLMKQKPPDLTSRLMMIRIDVQNPRAV
ncbi:hypothetical protein L3X38_016877 [Prunus dulcis]|uniref:Reverse transcriptase Ty1/copia-type domain-containing protein n=1 Tax=Prunus dulcis TaxID=3755 RepID=A0AAD4W8N1_PRUDU|nr:hypothetical protein L3X38_016877 [Prunus dulcis]